MRPPDAERGARTAPRSDQPTPRQLDLEPQNSRAVVAVDPSGVAVMPVELRELLGGLPSSYPSTQAALTDVERLAMALVDTFGGTWCRRLALELLEVSGELLGDRRNVWGGEDR